MARRHIDGMDETKLRSAMAMLQAIAEKLEGDVEEKYVELYHNTLRSIQEQLGCDLSPFLIPANELERHVTSFRYGRRIPRIHTGPDVTYSDERYCDEARFQIALTAAMNFISGHLQSPSPVTLKRNG